MYGYILGKQKYLEDVGTYFVKLALNELGLNFLIATGFRKRLRVF